MEYQSSIVIFPPHRVQAFAIPLMRKYCFETMLRAPAHITVLFPFVPLDELEAACWKVSDICNDIPPFEITLDGYGFFPNAAYMKLANPEPVKALFRAIHAQFPNFPPYRGAHGSDDIHPHLTVGVFDSQSECEAAEFPPYDPITFTVRHLHLISGVERQPLPWITQEVVTLGGRKRS